MGAYLARTECLFFVFIIIIYDGFISEYYGGSASPERT